MFYNSLPLSITREMNKNIDIYLQCRNQNVRGERKERQEVIEKKKEREGQSECMSKKANITTALDFFIYIINIR